MNHERWYFFRFFLSVQSPQLVTCSSHRLFFQTNPQIILCIDCRWKDGLVILNLVEKLTISNSGWKAVSSNASLGWIVCFLGSLKGGVDQDMYMFNVTNVASRTYNWHPCRLLTRQQKKVSPYVTWSHPSRLHVHSPIDYRWDDGRSLVASLNFPTFVDRHIHCLCTVQSMTTRLSPICTRSTCITVQYMFCSGITRQSHSPPPKLNLSHTKNQTMTKAVV
jgi:hypothetical protein